MVEDRGRWATRFSDLTSDALNPDCGPARTASIMTTDICINDASRLRLGLSIRRRQLVT